MDMMDRRETIRFIESCRLCLRKPGVFNVFKIKGLLLDIYAFTGVKVFLAEDLPQMICRECSSILQNMKDLRETAKTNDEHMRSLVNDKLEESNKEVEQALVEQKPECLVTNTSDEESASFSLKTEIVAIEEPLCVEEPCTSQVTVRSDLFSAESQSSPEVPASSKWFQGDKIKKESSIENIESMYDFESSLITETCSQWFQPSFSDGGIKTDGAETAESSYRCEACAKDFTTWKKFYYHNRFHNKSIECSIEGCMKKFATKGDLEKHMRTHTGEKPYQCELCYRRFTQRGTLRVHRVMVHSLKRKELIIGT